jgi:hypothetical protein
MIVYVSRICMQFLEIENVPVLLACILTRHVTQLSMFGMLWNYVHDRELQFPPISSNFAQPLKRSGTTFHRLQTAA